MVSMLMGENGDDDELVLFTFWEMFLKKFAEASTTSSAVAN